MRPLLRPGTDCTRPAQRDNTTKRKCRITRDAARVKKCHASNNNLRAAAFNAGRHMRLIAKGRGKQNADSYHLKTYKASMASIFYVRTVSSVLLTIPGFFWAFFLLMCEYVRLGQFEGSTSATFKGCYAQVGLHFLLASQRAFDSDRAFLPTLSTCKVPLPLSRALVDIRV